MAHGDLLGDAGRAAAALVPSAPPAGVAYALLFDAGAWGRSAGEALALLSPGERARSMRLRFERDRTTYVLAHALWRVLLGRCVGSCAADVPLAFAATGQPQLPGTGWVTSLSHSGTLVLLAAARASALGVDIERVRSSARLHELAAEICAPAELDSLRALPEGAREQALLRTWTRKEALLKAAGLGLACPPSGFAAPTGVPISLPGVAAAQACAVHDLAPAPGWAGAWAAPPEVGELLWRRLM